MGCGTSKVQHASSRPAHNGQGGGNPAHKKGEQAGLSKKDSSSDRYIAPARISTEIRGASGLQLVVEDVSPNPSNGEAAMLAAKAGAGKAGVVEDTTSVTTHAKQEKGGKPGAQPNGAPARDSGGRGHLGGGMGALPPELRASEAVSTVSQGPPIGSGFLIPLDDDDDPRRYRMRGSYGRKLYAGGAKMQTLSQDQFRVIKDRKVTGDFTVMKTIGHGSFGSVKLLRSTTTSKIYAGKYMFKPNNAKFSDGDFDEEEIMNEISTMQRLKHSNVVRLYRVYDENDQYVMVLQYAKGGELFQRIRQEKKYTEFDAARAMVDLLAGLVYLHENGIAHRDLKPENLLYASEAKDSDLLIADFGFAKMRDGAKMFTTFCGSPVYMAPEIIGGRFSQDPHERKHRFYDIECDIWSAGVILYILLCGYPPFLGRNSNMTMRKIRRGVYSFPDNDWGMISDEAKDLVSQMLVMNPVDRISADTALLHPWIVKHAFKRLSEKRKELANTLQVDLLRRLDKVKRDESFDEDSSDSVSLSTISNMSQVDRKKESIIEEKGQQQQGEEENDGKRGSITSSGQSMLRRRLSQGAIDVVSLDTEVSKAKAHKRLSMEDMLESAAGALGGRGGEEGGQDVAVVSPLRNPLDEKKKRIAAVKADGNVFYASKKVLPSVVAGALGGRMKR
eukprot:CAMPEP_0113886430 /NCGR_PEP_ID=MMETSP0780_2-20120614/11550_1 /TAXON_ID=652834 /ORGANISM="Palpitomonas bilix" /LENGTH=672 /DNA_ID=CAMNT_0000874643 /DNA_START=460 /DNA_END=2478 /DNA_ORIENTATION=+ /assembly_acc=CAM_ASM_000599